MTPPLPWTIVHSELVSMRCCYFFIRPVVDPTKTATNNIRLMLKKLDVLRRRLVGSQNDFFRQLNGNINHQPCSRKQLESLMRHRWLGNTFGLDMLGLLMRANSSKQLWRSSFQTVTGGATISFQLDKFTLLIVCSSFYCLLPKRMHKNYHNC